jgi:pimeloyl-ACP methyl ester carboxylesterase
MHAIEPAQRPAPLAQWLAAAWAQEAAVHSVEVEGATVRYREWGVAGKPGLAFVHGFLAHARWWDHIAPQFTDRYHVIAPDLTGMGDSDRRPHYSRRQFAREIIAALRDSGLTQVTLVAHSFGSVSALLAAQMAPDLIRRVIVIDAHVFRTDAEDRAEVVQSERRYATPEEAIARYRLKPAGMWPEPEIFSYLARHSLREVDGQWGWKFDPRLFAATHETGLRESLRGLNCPVDFIRAAHSEIVGDAEAAAFVANLPQCGEPVTVPLSHHHIMIEQPLALVSALNGLLAHPR